MPEPDLIERTLLAEADDEAARVQRLGDGHVGLLSRRSPAKDTVNEDAALALSLGDDAALLAVADGCGGMPAAAEAAARALDALGDAVADAPDSGDLLSRALAGFDAANRAVRDLRVGAGATLVAAIVAGGDARVLHAGDSMALVTGQRGRVRLQIIPHSPTGYGVEAGLLTEHEALTHEERSTILNLVGAENMRVEIGHPIRLAPRDTLLLASDGLADNLFADEIVAAIRSGPLDRALDSLAALADDRMRSGGEIGHPDDLTLVAYRPTPLPR